MFTVLIFSFSVPVKDLFKEKRIVVNCAREKLLGSHYINTHRSDQDEDTNLHIYTYIYLYFCRIIRI